MRTRFLWMIAAMAVLLPGTGISAVTTFGLTASSGTSTATPSPRPTPPPVVSYEKLIPFLPKTPEGWTAENPSGSTTDIEVFNLSTATQTYQMGDDETAPVTTVTIIDAGGHKGYFDTATGKWKFTIQNKEGYDKAVEIDGMPGYEHYNKAAKSASLCVIVAKRYFVQIEVTNQDPKELREWLKKMDLKKLAELK